MRTVDVVVVGAGVIGCATSRCLARAGREVVLLEQFEVGHGRGSSHGASRIFRLSYSQAVYVRMAMEALPLWRELEEESGEPILITLGGLDLGSVVAKHAAALQECGADFEIIDRDEASARFPLVRLPKGEAVLFQPDAGIVAADRAVRGFARSAVAHGAKVREGARVLGLHTVGDSAEVRTAEEIYRCRAVVVTAGAWARNLLAGVGYDLPTWPSRETVAYFRIGDELQLPTLVEWGEPSLYALPSPGQGIKGGEHRAGVSVDPNSEGSPDEKSIARLCRWVGDRFPDVQPVPHQAETCLYTNTSDERFILERWGPVVVGSACSGHGFKFAPLIGRKLADLATSHGSIVK